MKQSTDLIAEESIRDALKSFQVNREAFNRAVEERVQVRPADENNPQRAASQSPWLSVAASVCPLPLAAGASKIALVPYSQLPLAAKAVGALAWPMASLVTLLAGAFLGARVIQTSMAGAKQQPLDDEQVKPIAERWWSTYGSMPNIIVTIALVAMLFGYATPVLVVLLASSVATVVLISRLASVGSATRGQLAGLLAASLGSLAQVLFIFTIFNQGTHLLDQGLPMAVAYLGAGGLALLASGPSALPSTARTKLRPIHTAILLTAAVLCANSLWLPVGQQSLVTHVESFDHARFSSATWRRWAVPASWLHQRNHLVDLTKPRSLLERELNDEQNPYLMTAAMRGGLFDKPTCARVQNLEEEREYLLDETMNEDRLTSIEQDYAILRSLLMLEQLTGSELDTLEKRMLVTIDEAGTREIHELIDPLLAVELLEAMGRPLTNEHRRANLRELVASFQRTATRFGSRPGGFATYNTTPHADTIATVTAIQLIERVGYSDQIDTLALHSFLRPSLMDRLEMLIGSTEPLLRETARQRLLALPDVKPLSWWDYLRCEQPLVLTSLLVGLCFYAVWNAPRSLEAKAP